ncbi:MAG: cytochrome P450 [Planctomycetaceae bacterium]|nr:cytochrome P450 [Planctomycetaceae bacterium]
MSESYTLPLPQSGLPITHGRIADFADDPLVCMRRLWARHGEVCALQEGNQRIFFVFGPEYNRQVLSDASRFHSRFFAAYGPRKSAQRRVTSGLLSMNGEEHRRHRRMVQGPLQKKAIVAYHENVAAVSEDAFSQWQIGETRDVAADMTNYMLRLTCAILFGLDHPELAYKVGELTERWVGLNHEVGAGAFTGSVQASAAYDELLDSAKELEVAVKELLAVRRDSGLGTDILSLLIRAHDEEGGISDEHLIGHITLLFGAAHLTSAHTLSWTLFLLAQHPEVMQELHDELNTVLGGRTPKPEDLDRFEVLERVIKESMRVLPASAYVQRIAAEPLELGPFQLQQGSVVVFSQFMSHHLPEQFEQPERFHPDRWKTISPSPYAYLPFGAGPRMCIGAALGMMQLKISLPMLLQRFKLNVVAGAEINARAMSTMLYPTSAMPMRVQAHDGEFTNTPVTGSIHTLVDLPPACQPQRDLQRRVA